MLKNNISHLAAIKTSGWRKIAMGTWHGPGDPSVYGLIDIDATPLLALIEKYKKEGTHLTPTTIVAKGIATALKDYPSLNSIIRFGRLYRRDDIDIFLQVSNDEASGEDLSGMVIRNCDQKSLQEIGLEIRKKASKIRSEGDPEFRQSKNTLKFFPSWAVYAILKTLSFVLYTLNLWSPLFKMPRDPMGSVMVTSVGMLGLDYGFAPLVPYSRCPLVVTVGKIHSKPIVNEKNEIVACPMLPLSATFDHRLLDGVGAAKLLKALRHYFNNPF